MRLVISFSILAALALRAESPDQILARMDAEAAQFKGVKAQIAYDEFSKVLNEHTKSTISLTLVKGKKNVTALLDYIAPDPKQWLMKDGVALEYVPKAGLVNQYDASKYSSMVNQFMTLAFGSSGAELKKNYTITLAPPDPSSDSKNTKLVLVPRKPEALEYMKKIEYWVPEGKSYAVQVRIYQPNNDTNTAAYSDIKINPQGLTEKDIVLKAPKGVRINKIN